MCYRSLFLKLLPPLSLQDHRAPSVGFFLLGLSAAVDIVPSSTSHINAFQKQAEWAGEVLAPALVSFDFLWLSQDLNTANILLCGSCLLLGLWDWVSADTLTVLTHTLSLSSLSCCLIVCLFASQGLGALGGVALSLPLLMTPQVGTSTLTPLVSSAASDRLVKWVLKGFLTIGCWASTKALSKFLLDVTERCELM